MLRSRAQEAHAQARCVEIARAFFSAFSGGELAKARALAAEDFRWFGVLADASAWTERFPRFVRDNPLTLESAQAVDRELLQLAPSEQEATLFGGGAVGLEDQLVRVELIVGGKRVTAAALLRPDGDTFRVLRVFDPMPYVELVRARSAATPKT